MSTGDDGFCPLCDVTLDLHDGPNTCHLAASKADLLADLDRAFGFR